MFFLSTVHSLSSSLYSHLLFLFLYLLYLSSFFFLSPFPLFPSFLSFIPPYLPFSQCFIYFPILSPFLLPPSLFLRPLPIFLLFISSISPKSVFLILLFYHFTFSVFSSFIPVLCLSLLSLFYPPNSNSFSSLFSCLSNSPHYFPLSTIFSLSSSHHFPYVLSFSFSIYSISCLSLIPSTFLSLITPYLPYSVIYTFPFLSLFFPSTSVSSFFTFLLSFLNLFLLMLPLYPFAFPSFSDSVLYLSLFYLSLLLSSNSSTFSCYYNFNMYNTCLSVRYFLFFPPILSFITSYSFLLLIRFSFNFLSLPSQSLLSLSVPQSYAILFFLPFFTTSHLFHLPIFL
ncbi:hypothetical protein J437_LFUL009599 [Ladona fulva]|uniref:Uncharacterized protein n=1 Tax=Ladona fulva TaxID=123851 RepID=A0A8K0JTN2_LADFU|nr:hypothetical protein J437_LFUL009599 [Ladona fulva]